MIMRTHDGKPVCIFFVFERPACVSCAAALLISGDLKFPFRIGLS